MDASQSGSSLIWSLEACGTETVWGPTALCGLRAGSVRLEGDDMFERYTEKARRVIFFARYEASQFGSP